MELGDWFVSVAVLLSGFAITALITVVVTLMRRVKRLEDIVTWQDERVYDLAQSVDKPTKQRYESRRATRRTVESV